VTRYLLDAHTAIWWWTASPKLGVQARAAIAAGDAPVFVSAASVWEIAIKSAKGRLPEIESFHEDYPLLMARNRFGRLDVNDEHALRAGYLAGEHRDPFDRIIAAQGLVEDMTVLTRDPQVAALGCKVLW
jgi:PIN domain nuclease of toxin-antitoxin system